MELALSSAAHRHPSLPLSLHHLHRCPSSKPISFPQKSPFSRLTPIKSSTNNQIHQTPKPQITKPLNPNPFSVLKTTLITGVAITAVFFSRFALKPTIAATVSSPPSTVETTDFVSEEEEEKTLEEHLSSHPYDTKALKTLMELKIKNKKVHEAISVIDRLISLEPDDGEWPLLKSHLHSYSGDHDSAKLGFEEIISKHPLRVEAYHGLVMAASGKESPVELQAVEKRILVGMERCKKEKKKEDVRDFKLLLAQIRVIQGEYKEAIKIYEELSKEEARDFRPYLCLGIIYTLLGKNDEAEKYFQKYRRLVPKGHPYTQYFDENMVASKVFAQKVANERAYSKS